MTDPATSGPAATVQPSFAADLGGLGDALEGGLILADVLLDETGAPMELRYLSRQDTATAVLGISLTSQPMGKVETLHDRQWLEAIGRVLRTGKPERLRLHQGEGDRWFELRAFRLDDQQPGSRVAISFCDVTSQTEEAGRIQQSECDLRLLTTLIPTFVWRTDPEGGAVSLNERILEYTGLTGQDMQEGGWLRALHPDDVQGAQAIFTQAFQTGEAVETQFRIRSRKGEYRWFLVRQIPFRDESGQLRHWFGTATDIEDHWQLTESLRDSEERFQQFSAASTDILWIRDVETLQWEFLSPAFDGIYGLSRAEALCGDNMKNWEQLIHPEDRSMALERIRQVMNGAPVVFEYRIVRPSDGAVRWLRNTDFALHDARGRIHRIGGIGHDVTSEKANSERLQLLVAELQHRTRNLIAVVQAVTNRTAATTANKEELIRGLFSRFAALARVNGLLSQLSDFDRVSLKDILSAELSAHALVEADDRITLTGPDAKLPSFAVQTLALALHELATNAVKHGALARIDGRLGVQWDIQTRGPDKWLHFVWTEHGSLAPAIQSGRTGFGIHLITRALPYQMGAETTFRFTEDGVECVLILPLT